MSMMNPLGLIASFLYPFVFLKSGVAEDEFKTQVRAMMISFIWITATSFILTVLTFFDKRVRNKLESEPLLEGKSKKPTRIMAQIKQLMKDRAYVGMLLACSVAFGSFGGFGVSVNFLVSVWGYDEVRSG